MRSRTLVAVALSSLLLGVVLGQLLPSARANSTPSDDGSYRQLALFAEAMHTIRTRHIDPPETKELIESAIEGMTQSLDEHSAYLHAGLLQMLREDNAGEYLGVGVELLSTPEGPRVLRVFPDSPAARRGLQAGDILLAIDGKPLERESVEHIVLEMRQSKEQHLRLTVARGERVFDVEIEKDLVHVDAVTVTTMPTGQLWIKLQQFNEDSSQTLKAALQRDRGAAAQRGVILDLRDNPGGLLSEAIAVAQLFLDRGVIVRVHDGEARSERYWSADPKRTIYRGPLVVLLNQNSASGSEIVAAALRDNNRAPLVGRRSFGKGTVQSILTLLDGSALKLTVTEYFGPKGYCIHHVGVIPDYEIAAALDDAPPATFDAHPPAPCRTELDPRQAVPREASARHTRALADYDDPALALASELLYEQQAPARTTGR